MEECIPGMRRETEFHVRNREMMIHNLNWGSHCSKAIFLNLSNSLFHSPQSTNFPELPLLVASQLKTHILLKKNCSHSLRSFSSPLLLNSYLPDTFCNHPAFTPISNEEVALLLAKANPSTGTTDPVPSIFSSRLSPLSPYSLTFLHLFLSPGCFSPPTNMLQSSLTSKNLT